MSLLRDEMRRFRRLLGEQSFWRRPEEQRDTARDALLHLYLHELDVSGSDGTAFDACVTEYRMRSRWMKRRGSES